MTKPSLKLLFLRKYRTSKKYYRQLRLPSAINGSTLSLSGVFPSRNKDNDRSPLISNTTGNHASANSLGTRATSHHRKKSSTEPLDTVDCCLLICDCLSHFKFKLRTFVFIVVIGFVSTIGIYLHNQRLLQYRLSNNTPYNSNSSSTNVLQSVIFDTLNLTSRSTSALKKLLLNFPQHHRLQNDDDNITYLNRVYRGDVFSPSHGIRLKRCTIPQLKPFASEIKQFIGYKSRPNCAREQSNSFDDQLPFSLKNGTVLVRNPKLDASQIKGCCYRPFHRNGDNNYWSSNFCKAITEEVTQLSEVEYMELLCVNSATSTDFRDGFAPIPRKEKAESRIETFESVYDTSSSFSSQTNPRLSVVILGLDATSRMNFLRAMPKSNKYLLKSMSAISLDGYTKVAENTLPNVIPLLTGRTLEVFKKECVDESLGGHHVHLDECPFIWKTFAKNGYRTSLAEDDVDIGIFNMNWGNAFIEAPTDYYLRPFSHLMQKRHSSKEGYCYGPSLSFDKLLENVRSMAEAFQGQTYFQFTWSTKLSHDDFNKLRWGDESLLQLLQHLNSGDYLNNTVLIICGDHGSRLDRIRTTAQGKIEDRMPIAYIVLPRWFRTKYHRAYRNLRQNANRITSAFDLHKTLYDFLNLDNLLKKKAGPVGKDEEIIVLPNEEKVSLSRYRGLSLFNEVPENRTCFEAGIPLHWCVCHRKIPMDKESDLVQGAAEFVVASLNTLMKDFSSCSELLLQSVDEVSKWDSTEILREGCVNDDGSKSINGTVTVGNGNNSSVQTTNDTSCLDEDSEVLVLQVAFTTTPGDATFETTLIHLSDGRWRLTEDVVRTNSYEGQSDCVEQKLKPYCYCSDDESFLGGLFK